MTEPTPTDGFTPDVIVVGAGLAGLVATHELALAGKRVLVLDQENRDNLGGQAWWSLGGLLFVDSPEQRRMGIKDSPELAWQDWQGSAQFDRLGDGTDGPGRGEDFWPQQWAKAYVDFAHREKRAYLHDLGLRSLPFVGWAERGDGRATGHGNSVPRFHLTWGTGPEVVRIFAEPVERAEAQGLVRLAFRHQVDELVVEDGAVVGVRGTVLADDDSARGVKSSREAAGDVRAPRRRRRRDERRHRPQPRADAAQLAHRARRRRARAPHLRRARPRRRTDAGHRRGRRRDDGQQGPDVGLRRGHPQLGPGLARPRDPDPARPVVDVVRRHRPAARGHVGRPRRRLDRRDEADPAPTGHDYSWFVLTQSIIEKEFALSGSEQNPDITGKDLKFLAQSRLAKGAPGPVEAFKEHGVDFVVADTLAELVTGMNELARGPELDLDDLERHIVARDREVDNAFTKDIQVMAIHNARRSRTDKLIRVAKPHKVLDPAHGPLIAVRLNILSRKTLGGLETDLDGQCVAADGTRVPGLYAAGEVAGFGGGGVHGYNALEGTFLGGCIFSGRAVGRALAR